MSRIDRQHAYASNPHTIQTHFRKLEKVIRDNDIKDNGITNVDEKGFVMGISPRTRCVTNEAAKTHVLSRMESGSLSLHLKLFQLMALCSLPF